MELAVIKKLRPAKLTSVVGVGGNRTATSKSGEIGERECGGRENHSAFVARTDFGSHSMTHQTTLISSAPAAFSASHSLHASTPFLFNRTPSSPSSSPPSAAAAVAPAMASFVAHHHGSLVISLSLAQTRTAVAAGRKFAFLIFCYCTRGD